MEFFFVRHGQTVGNVSGIAGLDPPLTETGAEQVRRAASRLVQEGVTHLYCSPLYRALQTVEILREVMPLDPVISPVFCETWGTGWNARTADQLRERFPWAQLPASMEAGRWWPQVAETPEEIDRRAREALGLIAERHRGTEDGVCLIGHIEFGRVMFHHLMGLNSNRSVSFTFRNASFSQIRWLDEARKLIVSLNDVHHLPVELWTI
ncbi:MAG: histidine phosphatase family protein [bacterium]